MGCATWAGFRCRCFITGAKVGVLRVMIVWKFIMKTINDCVEAFFKSALIAALNVENSLAKLSKVILVMSSSLDRIYFVLGGFN